MPMSTVDGKVEITLEPSKFDAFRYQENDYNNHEDIMLDSIRSKAGMLIRDFGTEGILSIAFPTVFCNES